MRTFRIEFSADNAAFENFYDEVPAILRRVAKRVSDGHNDGAVTDSNGNMVGAFTTEERAS